MSLSINAYHEVRLFTSEQNISESKIWRINFRCLFVFQMESITSVSVHSCQWCMIKHNHHNSHIIPILSISFQRAFAVLLQCLCLFVVRLPCRPDGVEAQNFAGQQTNVKCTYIFTSEFSFYCEDIKIQITSPSYYGRYIFWRHFL